MRLVQAPLRNLSIIAMLAATATLMLNSSGAGTTTEWLGCAGCTRACCSWSLAFLGSFWPFGALPQLALSGYLELRLGFPKFYRI